MSRFRSFAILLIFLLLPLSSHAESIHSVLKPSFTMTLSATSPGPIRLYVKEGANVPKGKALFGVATQTLELQAQLAQVQWKQSKLRLKETTHPKSEKELEHAKRVLDQQEVLFRSGAISKERFQMAQLEFELSTQNHRPEAINLAHLDVEAAFVRLKLARQTLEDATFEAPDRAIVHQLLVHPNEWVQPGKEVMVLISIHPLLVEADIPLKRARSLQLGQRLDTEISVGHRQETVHATISTISNEVEAVTQTIRVRLEIHNESLRFKPGMQANVVLP